MDPNMDPNAKPPLQPHQTPEYLAQDKAPSIVATCIAVSVASTLFVFARLFTRQKIMGKLHLDDYLVASAVPFQWTCTALAIVATTYGNGKHFDTLSINEMQGAIFWTILGFPFGIMAFAIPKLAVVALLQRLLNPNRWHQIFLWILASLCTGALLGCVVILFAQCSPAESQWNFAITDKTCIDKWILVDYAIFAGGFSAFTDLYLAIYPAVVLWKLQINIKKKIALCFALGIGSIATVVAIYKCTRLPSLASADFSYNTSDLVIWTVVEAGTIIIACCIPVLQPLVDLIFGRRTLGSSGSYRKYGSRSGSGHLKSDIEMDKGMGGSSYQSSAQRSRLASSKNNTLTGSRAAADDDAESQDSILRDDFNYHNHHTDAGGKKKAASSGHAARSSDGRILRTDSVTVTYHQNAGATDEGTKNSAAAGGPNKSWMRI